MTVETTTSGALVARFRSQWALLHTQWVAVPATLQRAWEHLGDQVRHAFNLPTRDELAQLATRLDEIDARLRELSAPAKNGSKKKA